jgi:hypothetical protein
LPEAFSKIILARLQKGRGKVKDLRFASSRNQWVELGIIFNVEAEAGGGFKLFSLIDLSGKAKTGDAS